MKTKKKYLQFTKQFIKVVSSNIEKEILSQIDELIREGIVPDRSSVYRSAISFKLLKEANKLTKL